MGIHARRSWRETKCARSIYIWGTFFQKDHAHPRWRVVVVAVDVGVVVGAGVGAGVVVVVVRWMMD
jgi:hypothetical protein